MENVIAINRQTGKAVEGYLLAWDQLNVDQLQQILMDKASIFIPKINKVKGKDRIIEVHQIWFENMSMSSLPGIETAIRQLKSMAGTNHICSEIRIFSAHGELLFRFKVTHDTYIIYGIELMETDFLTVIRKYEVQNNGQ